MVRPKSTKRTAFLLQDGQGRAKKPYRWRIVYYAFEPPKNVIGEWRCKEESDGTFSVYELLEAPEDFEKSLHDPSRRPWKEAPEKFVKRLGKQVNLADEVRILDHFSLKSLGLTEVRKQLTATSEEEAVRRAEKLERLHERFKEDWDTVGPSPMFDDFKSWRIWRDRVDAQLERERIWAAANEERQARRQEFIEDMMKTRTVIQAAEEVMATSGLWLNGKHRAQKPSWIRRQQNYVNHLREADFAETRMDQLGLHGLRLWWRKWCGDRAPGTAFRFRSWLVRVGRISRRPGYWPENLFEDLDDVPRAAVARQRVWELSEVDALWTAAIKPREAALLVLLRCGLRQGEAIAIREADLDFDPNTVHVRWSMGRRNVGSSKRGEQKFEPYVDAPKTSSSAAALRLPMVWMDVLKKSLADSAPCDVPCAVPHEGQAQRFVIHSSKGHFLTDTASTKLMQRILKRSGVGLLDGDATWHSWRYSLAADDMHLRELMRHSDHEVSKRLYARARKDIAYYRTWRQGVHCQDQFLTVIAEMDEARRKKLLGSKEGPLASKSDDGDNAGVGAEPLA